MKRKLLFAAALVAGALCFEAQAQTTWTASDLAAGKYVFQNVGSGRFLGPGNSWGTQASLLAQSHYNTLAKVGDGVYTIESQVSNGGTNYYFAGGFMDGAATNVTIADNGDGIFTMSNGTNYYGYDGSTTVLASNLTDPTNENAQWKIIAYDDYLASATVDNPVDATYRILDQNFDRNNRNGGGSNNDLGNKWTMVASNQNLCGGKDNNKCAESWRAAFTLSQTVTLPNGYYKVRAQAALTEYTVTGNDFPVVYAGDKTTPFLPMQNGENSMDAMSEQFTAGNYFTEWSDMVTVTTKSLTLGVKGTRTDTWCIWDNIQLMYYGPLDLSETIAAYESALDKAKSLTSTTAKYEASLLTSLNDAISTYDSVDKTSEEDLNEAIDALSTAANNLEASIAAYESTGKYFEKMKAVLDNTNVYTEEAYNAVYGTWLAKYEANTLETATAATLSANAAYSTGWHSTNKIDEILLSTWTIGGEQAKDYDKALYINTWSTEGNTDGSEFYTPFFEYWTGDAESLNANTLVSTVTGLNPNTTYSFTIRARVRQTNNKTKIAEGITMKVGDGTAVDISAGTQFNGGVFYIGNFSAVGQTDAEGTLTTTITVAANSNISWLSFYNCKYTEGEDLSAYVADYQFALTSAQLVFDAAYMESAAKTTLASALSTYKAENVNVNSKAELIAAKDALNEAANAVASIMAPINGSDISKWTSTTGNGSFQVNTWSVEGNTDGSGMKTPFTQLWIGSGTNLQDATMSYTIEGLTAGYYKVTALIRSLNEAGGSTPAGSYIFANDGIARAFEGTACTNGVFDNPIVYGLVGEDGKLTIGVKTIDANVNWVSWKNFSYEYVGATLADAATMTVNAEAKYATFCAPFEVAIPEGVSAYTVDGVEENGYTLTLSEVKVTIPANTPVVLSSESAVAKEFNGVAVGGTPTEGLLTGVYAETTAPKGAYVLQNQNDKVGFYKVEAVQPTVGAFRAYLTAPAEAKAFYFAADDATAIEAISALADGQIEAVYTVNGAKVNGLQKGLNIVKMQNGTVQKVLVK